ncbi:uncharacterized protein N7479_006166 [Penicillium vulpinum]|uniref:uncharacterized protein n=1 Tax=Penicillium vulpinum TaxID=29845 RepID=UPI002548D083|nr:uncharacterized protein N7479_006166 [Penicillium vulpinum]KAJ5959016.1 hypothetical protein N7479_006166 [Penicillium vulpinum]
MGWLLGQIHLLETANTAFSSKWKYIGIFIGLISRRALEYVTEVTRHRDEYQAQRTVQAIAP